MVRFQREAANIEVVQGRGRLGAIADTLSREAPEGIILLGYWVPSIRAAAQLERAVRQREPSKSCGQPLCTSGRRPHPFLLAYLRAQAYLAAREPQLAAGEFHKVIDHRGVVLNNPVGALALPGLARANADLADTVGARQAH